MKTTLPNKWCIQITIENHSAVYGWLNKNSQNGTNTYPTNLTDPRNGDIRTIIHYPVVGKYHQRGKVELGYTEITFEEFETLVLKKSPITDRRTKFKVGDEVIYNGERTKVAAIPGSSISLYIVLYSDGWLGSECKEKNLDPLKKYNYATESSLELVESTYSLPEKPEPKTSNPQRWKKGDIVTYKKDEQCCNNHGVLGFYYHGGNGYAGFRGKIISYDSFNSSKNCWDITVTTSSGSKYLMLESEFEEWDIGISQASVPVSKCWCILGGKELATFQFRNWKGNPKRFVGDAIQFYHFDGNSIVDCYPNPASGYPVITIAQFKAILEAEKSGTTISASTLVSIANAEICTIEDLETKEIAFTHSKSKELVVVPFQQTIMFSSKKKKSSKLVTI